MALLDLTRGAVEKKFTTNTSSRSVDYSKIKTEIYPDFGKFAFEKASNPDLAVNKKENGLDIKS